MESSIKRLGVSIHRTPTLRYIVTERVFYLDPLRGIPVVTNADIYIYIIYMYVYHTEQKRYDAIDGFNIGKSYRLRTTITGGHS